MHILVEVEVVVETNNVLHVDVLLLLLQVICYDNNSLFHNNGHWLIVEVQVVEVEVVEIEMTKDVN